MYFLSILHTALILKLLVHLSPGLCSLKSNLHMAAFLPRIDDDYYGWKHMMEKAVQLINRNDSVLPNHRLVIHYKDTDRGILLDEMHKALLHLPTSPIIFGPGHSDEILLTMPWMQRRRVHMVTFSTFPGEHFDYLNVDLRIFMRRAAPQQNTFDKVKMMILKKFNWKNVALVHSFEFLNAALELEKQMDFYNITIRHKFEYSSPTDEIDLLGNAFQVFRENQNRILFAEFYNDQAAFFCKAHKHELYTPKFVWIVRQPLVDGWFLEKSDCSKQELLLAAEGHFAINYTTYPNKEGWFVGDMDNRTNLFIRDNGSELINQYAGYAYDGVWAAAMAMDGTFRNYDVSALSKTRLALAVRSEFNKVKFEGLTGHFRYSGKNLQDREADLRILQYKKGKYVEVGGYNCITQEIFFYPDEEKLLFEDGRIPTDEVTVVTNIMSYDSTAVWVIAAMTVIGLIVAFVCLSINIIYRNHRAIKMSSPQVNNTCIFGCVVCYSSIILHGCDENIVSTDWLIFMSYATSLTLSLGFTIMFGAFFIKTWRVFRIFTAAEKLKKVKSLTPQMWALLATLVILDIGMFIGRIFLDPLYLTDKQASIQFADDQMQVSIIRETASAYQNYFAGSVLAYKGFILIFGLFLAWQTRNVSIELMNDSRSIGMAVYSVSAVSVIGVISVFALRGSTKYTMIYVITATCVSVCSTISLLIVFVPKIIVLFSSDDLIRHQTETKFRRPPENGRSSSVMSMSMSTKSVSFDSVVTAASWQKNGKSIYTVADIEIK